MKKIIKQLAVLGGVAAITLAFGCAGGDEAGPHHPDTGAPDSIEGKTATCTITGGTGGAADTGSFTIFFSATAYTLTNINGPQSPDSGTYTYTLSDPNTAVIQLDSTGVDGTLTVAFTSPTVGSYSYVSLGFPPGTQTGSFNVH